jgi:fatty-acid desaturase
MQLNQAQPEGTAGVPATHTRIEFLAFQHRTIGASSDLLAILTIILPLLGVVAAAHLAWSQGAAAAALVSCAIMYVLTFVGVEVGFHRHFAHRSFLAVRPV